jgi:hypothetical protein
MEDQDDKEGRGEAEEVGTGDGTKVEEKGWSPAKRREKKRGGGGKEYQRKDRKRRCNEEKSLPDTLQNEQNIIEAERGDYEKNGRKINKQ